MADSNTVTTQKPPIEVTVQIAEVVITIPEPQLEVIVATKS